MYEVELDSPSSSVIKAPEPELTKSHEVSEPYVSVVNSTVKVELFVGSFHDIMF